MSDLKNSKNRKVVQYLGFGILLTYYALKDEEFIIFYNGIALALGITSFSLAILAFTKK